MNTETKQAELFPVGGPRAAVEDALRQRGFQMSSWSDKHWDRPTDKVHAHVYGTGSRLRVSIGTAEFFDGPMANALKFIDVSKFE